MSTPDNSSRQRRHSRPTPPDRDEKRYKSDFESPLPSILSDTDFQPDHSYNMSKLTEEDIEKVANCIKSKIYNDIEFLIQRAVSEAVEKIVTPLKADIKRLRDENTRFQGEIDSQEQYSRRELIRVTGIKFQEGESPIDIVHEIVKSIDKDFKPPEVLRAHRVGKKENKQIIARVDSPSTKIRILRCRKYLKNTKYKDVRINEDLTKTRDMIAFHAWKLVREKRIKETWTTNGKIMIKDMYDNKHVANSARAFDELMVQLRLDNVVARLQD